MWSATLGARPGPDPDKLVGAVDLELLGVRRQISVVDAVREEQRGSRAAGERDLEHLAGIGRCDVDDQRVLSARLRDLCDAHRHKCKGS